MIPTTANGRAFFRVNALNRLNEVSNKNPPARVTLNIPTCTGEKVSSPRFIKMKELPHVSARTINNVQENQVTPSFVDSLMRKM